TMSDFAEIVFAILGVAAKLERRRILERIARGRADRKAIGVKFRRKPKPHQQRDARARLEGGETQRSGARADRRELLKLLKAIAPGDVVTVTRIDRLARSTFDLFAIVKQIVDAGGQFRSLAEPWADTATSTGRLMIAVLGGLAEFERDLIRKRTAEGRERAKARGVRLGRRPKLTDHQKREAIKRRDT